MPEQVNGNAELRNAKGPKPRPADMRFVELTENKIPVTGRYCEDGDSAPQ